MKIGIVTPFFYPFDGGAERNAFFLGKELAKKHDVTVFTSDKRGKEVIEKKYEVLAGMQIYRCRTFFRYRHYFGIYPELITKLLAVKLDILHVHGVGFPQQEVAVCLKKIFSPKTKIIITPHGPFMALKQYDIWKSVLKFLYMPLLKFFNKIYDTAIAQTPHNYSWFKEYGFKKIADLPAGIPQNFIAEKIDKKKSHVICYIGRLQKYKGVDQIIKVLPKLKDMFSDIKLILIGQDAGDKERLQNLAKELDVINDIIFAGKVSEDEKLKILDKSSVLVFPSEWEAFGIVILEAMARGLPVVSSKTEGGKFLIEEGANGYLFEFNNVLDLRRKLVKILSNKNLQVKMGRNNLEKVKRFVWPKLAKDLEEIYIQ